MVFIKRIIGVAALVVLLTLAACSSTGATTGSSTSTGAATKGAATPPVIYPPAQETATPTSVAHGATATPTASAASTPATTGPTVILTPTPVPGGGANSQQVTFPDRVLVIQGVTQQAGSQAGSTGVALVLGMKDTGAQSIQNGASFYQLVGSQGDIFGYQSSATPAFFGMIAPHSNRNGTIVFQVPTSVVSGGLRLLFRSEIASETVFVQLRFS